MRACLLQIMLMARLTEGRLLDAWMAKTESTFCILNYSRP